MPSRRGRPPKVRQLSPDLFSVTVGGQFFVFKEQRLLVTTDVKLDAHQHVEEARAIVREAIDSNAITN